MTGEVLACCDSAFTAIVGCPCVGRPKPLHVGWARPTSRPNAQQARADFLVSHVCQKSGDEKTESMQELREQTSQMLRGASSTRRIAPLSTAELTQAFLAHEDQLSILQAQTTILFKLPAEGSIARALLAAVQGWQRDHHPGQAHASCRA